jgi:peptidoglycan/xylan/chitin deacetylase (PgdA/CDA1 family)
LGHELANHGYTDAHPAQLSTGKLQAELRKTAKVIKDCCGQTPKYYSPFYGEYARQVVKTAAAMDYTVVRWSIDTVDWTLPGAELMVEATAHKLHPGAIILMHPTEQSAQALRGIMALLEKRGLELVPLSELLSPTWRPAIKPDAGY